MTYTITEITSGKKYRITLDYTDEGVTLPSTPSIKIKGTEEEAESYVAVFDKDIRKTFAEYFPTEETEMTEETEAEE